jgi:methoxymalonate biosynthesis acyl carrier protein
MSADLVARVATILRQRMAIDVDGPDTDLIAGGYLDSLAFVELLAHIEAEFSFRVRIEDLELEHVRTIAKIASFVAARAPTANPLEMRNDHGHPSAS